MTDTQAEKGVDLAYRCPVCGTRADVRGLQNVVHQSRHRDGRLLRDIGVVRVAGVSRVLAQIHEVSAIPREPSHCESTRPAGYRFDRARPRPTSLLMVCRDSVKS